MKKGYYTLAGAALALLLIPAVVGALNFDYEIYGNILDDPPFYGNGSLTSGADGFIQFTLSGDTWPLDPEERFTYLWYNYFYPNYDNTVPGAYKWVGTFTGTFFVQADNAPTGYNGWCWGTITPKITVWDANENGFLDPNEKFGENLDGERNHGSG